MGQPKLERLSQQASAAVLPLSIGDIVELERAGHSPAEIVDRLRASGARLSMGLEQEKRLREKGASAALIDALKIAEAKAIEADQLTAEADKAAAQRRRAEERQNARMYAPYPYYGYPYWGAYPYFGYGTGHHGGWYGGIGFGF